MVDWTDEEEAATFLRDQGVETDLSDAALHAKALAAVQSIAARGFGPQTDITAHLVGRYQTLIELAPPAATISSIEEEGVPLVADTHYRIRPGGRFIERLENGYTRVWSGRVVVIYDAQPANERYDSVVTDLVKLSIEYSGLDSRRDGDYAEEAAGARGGGLNSYQLQREQLISELAGEWTFA